MIDKILLDLSQQIGDESIANKVRISTAESCTGGLVASCLTSIEGASNYFNCGFVSYSDESKIQMLGVDYAIINKFGAISAETAIAMARGTLKKSGSELVVTITGIAGPSGGSILKPIGTVYFGIGSILKIDSYLYNFTGARQTIRYQACTKALELLLNALRA